MNGVLLFLLAFAMCAVVVTSQLDNGTNGDPPNASDPVVEGRPTMDDNQGGDDFSNDFIIWLFNYFLNMGFDMSGTGNETTGSATDDPMPESDPDGIATRAKCSNGLLGGLLYGIPFVGELLEGLLGGLLGGLLDGDDSSCSDSDGKKGGLLNGLLGGLLNSLLTTILGLIS